MPGFTERGAEASKAKVLDIPMSSIIPNSRQPRSRFDADALRELAASISEVGVLQPLIVRPLGDGRYELIAGERRLRAAKIAGLTSVPAMVRSASAQKSLEIALIENIQREDISPLECARSYRRLVADFGLTQDQVARKVGKSRVAISNTLRLLKLPEALQQSLADGVISEGHARALLSFESPARQLAVFHRTLAEGLSVRAVEEIARRQGSASSKERLRTLNADENVGIEALEDALSVRLGSPVKVVSAGKSGRVEITFSDEDDLGRIVEQLGVTL